MTSLEWREESDHASLLGINSESPPSTRDRQTRNVCYAAVSSPVKPSTKGRTLIRLCALTGVLALAVVPAAAQDVTTQFWPEIDTFIRLDENFRIYVPISKTREGTNNSGQDGTAGVYLDYYASPIANRFLAGPANAPRMHRLLLRLGYSYTAAGDGEPGTNTLSADATWRMTIPWELLLSDRNRFNLNFTGGDFDPRYRNRIQLERHVDLAEKTSLNPYAYGEFFYDFDQGAWADAVRAEKTVAQKKTVTPRARNRMDNSFSSDWRNHIMQSL